MRAKLSFFAGAVIAASLFAAPAASEEAKPTSLIYTLWTKTCLTDVCFTGISGEPASGCGPVFAATLIEHIGETKKILRISVPSSVDQARGVRIGIDQDQPIERPYVRCDARFCNADVESGVEVMDRLKQGRLLILEAIAAGNAPTRFELPLADFALAYEGPAQMPPPFRLVSHEEMLAIEARQAREKAERDARCGTKQ
jgi:invasion protein IalB